MGAGVARAPDLSDATVSRHHYHRGQVILQGPVEEGEALDVEHVNLVNEEDTWHKLGDTLVDIAIHNLVDLEAELLGDLGLAGFEHVVHDRDDVLAALGLGIGHVEVVEGHVLDNLFLLVHLALGEGHILLGL